MYLYSLLSVVSIKPL